MRIIIAGSRTFTDYPLLCETMDRLTCNLDKKKLVIVSGGAKGADKLGEQWAFERGIGTVEIFHADWTKHDKSAGPIRNGEMVDSCRPGKDVAVFFWDGSSLGTKDCLRKAKKRGLKVRVISFKKGAKK